MNSESAQTEKHKSIQLSGLLLWRFGLLMAASVGVYRLVRIVFDFVDIPIQLEIGCGLMLAGAIFFLVSLIAERVVAAREEGDLRKDMP